MKLDPVTVVRIYYKPMGNRIFVGSIALKNRNLFEYAARFIETGLNLSLFKLPLKSGVIAGDDFTLDGLFGVFNDSMPDGWRKSLSDRSLIKHSINPGSLSALDRLGAHGMGTP